jgi:hypothetical protein
MYEGYKDGVTVTVNTTGTLTGNSEYGCATDDDAYKNDNWRDVTKLTIQNATIKGSINASSDNALTGANIKITGGTFSSDPSAYVTDEKIAVKQDNGTYEVQTLTTSNAVAVVGETPYKTLQAAIDAADNDTVVLNNNVELNETMTVSGTVELDLAGHTVCAYAPYTVTYKDGTKGTATTFDTVIQIADGATLTVSDSVSGGKIYNGADLYYNSSNKKFYYIDSIGVDSGILTVSSGSVESGYAAISAEGYRRD